MHLMWAQYRSVPRLRRLEIIYHRYIASTSENARATEKTFQRLSYDNDEVFNAGLFKVRRKPSFEPAGQTQSPSSCNPATMDQKVLLALIGQSTVQQVLPACFCILKSRLH